MRWLIKSLLLTLITSINARSTTGDRLLVVGDDIADKDNYSQFLQSLESRGFIISFETPKATTLSLFKLGELSYEHLFILPSKAKGLGPKLTPNLLIDFIKKDGNILMALSGDGSIPSSLASTLLEFDITVPSERNAVIVDHFNYDEKTAADKHDVLRILSPKQSKAGIQNYFDVGGVLAVPRAVGQVLENSNPLLTPILRASDSAYSYDAKDENEALEDVFASGSQLSIITAFQARNSARLTVLGAGEMIQNKWLDVKIKGQDGKEVTCSNKAFGDKLAQWTFQEIGVVKVGRIEHHLNEQPVKHVDGSISTPNEINPEIYRIKNDITYSIELSEYSIDKYIPFTPAASDVVQLEFSMLSPFHRLNLQPLSTTHNSTLFTTSFTLPDQHGIFNFLVNYKRPFLTNVFEKRTVTVRHFAHDEWPRSFVISAAWPYVSSITVTIIGWLMFVGLWLYSKPVVEHGKVVAVKKVQ